MIKLEVGKTYKTRDGALRKVIYETNSGRFLVVNPDADNAASERSANGQSKADINFDLVEEYVEPVVEKKYMSVVKRPSGYSGDSTSMLRSTAGVQNTPTPYVANQHWEHDAMIELVFTDGKLTGVSIHEDAA